MYNTMESHRCSAMFCVFCQKHVSSVLFHRKTYKCNISLFTFTKYAFEVLIKKMAEDITRYIIKWTSFIILGNNLNRFKISSISLS